MKWTQRNHYDIDKAAHPSLYWSYYALLGCCIGFLQTHFCIAVVFLGDILVMNERDAVYCFKMAIYLAPVYMGLIYLLQNYPDNKWRNLVLWGISITLQSADALAVGCIDLLGGSARMDIRMSRAIASLLYRSSHLLGVSIFNAKKTGPADHSTQPTHQP